ncbi:MAG TPA: hypothetical protein PLW65_33360 [Pseudomonadota bacterium]|nr:hypothetical protein [Pseudomonadota bacterium]
MTHTASARAQALRPRAPFYPIAPKQRVARPGAGAPVLQGAAPQAARKAAR